MNHTLTKLAGAALTLSAVACSFHARAPEGYRDDTAALLNTNRAQIEACYTEALQADKALAGRVTINFVVQAETGAITNVEVNSEETNAPDTLSQCVISAVSGLALTPPDEREGQATFMFDFTTSQVAAG